MANFTLHSRYTHRTKALEFFVFDNVNTFLDKDIYSKIFKANKPKGIIERS